MQISGQTHAAAPGQAQAPRDLVDAVTVVVSEIRRDLDRARAVVREAVGSLQSSFQALNRQIEAQRAALDGVVKELVATTGISGGILGVTAQMVDSFIQELVRVSRDGIELVGLLDDMSVQVNEVVARSGGIEKLARQTRFLALNARIETHRAGDAGRTFKLVAEEVKRLALESAHLSEQIGMVVNETRSTLDKSRARATSMASHDITSAISSQRLLGDAIQKYEQVNQTINTALEAITNQVATAMRAASFEEAFSPLMDGATRRLDGLGAAVRMLVGLLPRMPGGEHTALAVAELLRGATTGAGQAEV